MRKHWILWAVSVMALSLWSLSSSAQLTDDTGQIHGNFQALGQQYSPDSLIGAQVPDEETTLNAFLNLIYTRGKFSAGLRYESYLPAQLGYPNRFRGNGIGYRFASFQDENIGITVGNFYEQFGNGLVLRSFEERDLGLDNALDGVRVTYNIKNAIYLKGLYGKMRFNFVDGLVNTDGFVRGFDGEVLLNQLIPSMKESKTIINFGGSFVSKFQADDRSDINLPENVGAWAARLSAARGRFSMFAEYAYKINDPSADNNFIYKDGQTVLANITYAQKGFSASLEAKSVDNFSYRPDRNLQITDATVNFLPALTKQHSYILAATFYPYATQPNGEVAYQAEVGYKVKKGTLLGGKYGMNITANLARAFAPDTTRLNDMSAARQGHTTNFFSAGKSIYFSDFNVELAKKFSNKVKGKLTYYNFVYNNTINQGAYFLDGSAVKGNVYADVAVLETTVKTAKKQSLRTELQYMRTNQHQGDWAVGVAEYTFSPHWILSGVLQYNHGNNIPENRLFYPFASVTYLQGPTRIAVEYGKRRAGIFCVGGVCRIVPASSGLTLTVSSSF